MLVLLMYVSAVLFCAMVAAWHNQQGHSAVPFFARAQHHASAPATFAGSTMAPRLSKTAAAAGAVASAAAFVALPQTTRGPALRNAASASNLAALANFLFLLDRWCFRATCHHAGSQTLFFSSQFGRQRQCWCQLQCAEHCGGGPGCLCPGGRATDTHSSCFARLRGRAGRPGRPRSSGEKRFANRLLFGIHLEVGLHHGLAQSFGHLGTQGWFPRVNISLQRRHLLGQRLVTCGIFSLH